MRKLCIALSVLYFAMSIPLQGYMQLAKPSSFSYRLTLHDNDRLMHTDVVPSVIRYDGDKKAYVATIDPKAMCLSCKENSARGRIDVAFSLLDDRRRFVLCPPLETYLSANDYYPVLKVNGQPSFIDVNQSNGHTVFYRIDFSMFEKLTIELFLYKLEVKNDQVRYVVQTGSSVKLIVEYKQRPVFKAASG